MNLRDEGKKAVLHVKQSHLYLKNKKNICQSTSHASSHLNTILHTGEKFGVLVKKKNMGNIWNFLHCTIRPILDTGFRPFDIDFIKKKNRRMKNSLQKINIGSLVTTTQAELWKPTLYAIPPRSVIFVSLFFCVRTMNESAILKI